MTGRSKRGLFGALLVALCALALAACGSSSKSSTTGTVASSGPGVGKPAVTIGDKNFTEEYILGQLYAQALEAKGYKVNLKPNIGSSEVIDKALTSGQIGMYPDYTGTIVSVLANDQSQPASAQAAFNEAKAFEQKRGFTLLNPTPFFDRDVLIVKPTYAQQHHLSSIADLKPLGTAVKYGAPPENKTRYPGLVGLQKAYGVFPTFVPLAIGLQYSALDSGQINVATAFSTDGQLLGNKYVQLSDPKNINGFQNVAPVVSQHVLSAEGPQFAQIINAVSAKLTLQAVQQMNNAVTASKQDPAVVARKFLQANGLV